MTLKYQSKYIRKDHRQTQSTKEKNTKHQILRIKTVVLNYWNNIKTINKIVTSNK